MDKDLAVAPSLTMKRRLDATPAEVFAAWTQPELLARWFGPEHVTVESAEVDLRVGGRYEIRLLENNGDRHRVGGAYHEIVENERLVFDWAWFSTPERLSRVTVTFKLDGDLTILTLLHEQFFDEGAAQRHTRGWTGSLAKLEHMFG